jgi:uncharacterized membrane protein (UPF0182 family)
MSIRSSARTISFYLLALPFYDDVLDIAIAILLFTIAFWFAARLFMHRATAMIHGLSAGGTVTLLPQSKNAQAVWVRQGDYPQGQANAETTYQGEGGIALSNLSRRLVIARQFDGPRLFISGYFTPQSRVMVRRNIVERVQTLAPFLRFDHDPYIVADLDHYSYIVDA